MPMPRSTDEFADVEVISPGGSAQPPRMEQAGGPQDPLFALIAHVMDSLFRIPGTQWRVGIDPVLGLLPGLGDTSGAIISALLILRGAQAGVPRVVLCRMAGNVLINTGVGAIPVLGDAFSAWFKSNRLNYELFERHAGKPGASKKTDWLFVGLLLTGLLLVVLFFVFLSATAVVALWKLVGGA